MTVLDGTDRRSRNAAPHRSVVQLREALDLANRVRYARADMKRDIKARRLNVLDVLEDVPWYAETMKVLDLLAAQRNWGPKKSKRLLARCGISESKTIGGMTPRQRNALIELLVWQ